jgi:hypothetical protein
MNVECMCFCTVQNLKIFAISDGFVGAILYLLEPTGGGGGKSVASFTVYSSLGLSITTDEHMYCCTVRYCKLTLSIKRTCKQRCSRIQKRRMTTKGHTKYFSISPENFVHEALDFC